MSTKSEYVVATEPLFIGTARAHNPGDLVRADTVDENGWQGKVTGRDTKAAQQAAQPQPAVVDVPSS